MVYPGGKGGRCVRLTTLPLTCAVVAKSGNLNFLEPSGPLQACNGTAIPVCSSLYLFKEKAFCWEFKRRHNSVSEWHRTFINKGIIYKLHAIIQRDTDSQETELSGSLILSLRHKRRATRQNKSTFMNKTFNFRIFLYCSTFWFDWDRR